MGCGCMGTLLHFRAGRCAAFAEGQVVNGARRRQCLAAGTTRPRLAVQIIRAGWCRYQRAFLR
jgi:hypothetical protein